jgi:hypothetical protein
MRSERVDGSRNGGVSAGSEGASRAPGSGWGTGLRAAGVAGLLMIATIMAAHARPGAAFPGVLDDAAGESLRVDRLAWLAGCWEGEFAGGRTYEEVWMAPRGGTLLGVSRMVSGGATVAWEHLRIAAEDGVLAYHAQPSGQAAARFAATEVSASSVTFANPEHDFPQRIIYRLAPPDSLVARVEGERNGQVRGSEFPMRRIACPG